MKGSKAFCAAIGIALSTMSCAQVPDEAGSAALDDFRPVRGGYALYGSQCPRGYFSAPKPAELSASCNTALSEIELTRPLQPLVLQADCREKIITVRNPDRSMDTSWEVMPDGYFDFTIDGGDAILKSDGNGHTDCVTPIGANIWGRLECKDRDVVDIDVHTNWQMGVLVDTRPLPSPSPGAVEIVAMISPTPVPSISPAPSPRPSPSPSPRPTPSASPSPRPSASPSRRPPRTVEGTRCVLPRGCKMVSSATINQCQ